MDISIYFWLLTLTRPIGADEYQRCSRLVQDVWPDTPIAAKLRESPPSYDLLREMLLQLMPLIMMRQQRIPRSKYKQHTTDRGKKWIEPSAEGIHPSKHLAMMMGYTACAEHNFIVMAAVRGKRHQVINLGISVKRCAVEPRGVSAKQWAQSLAHKLTAAEIQLLQELPDDKLISRICILLTIKESLINGLGQPLGFDLSRIDCSVPNQAIKVDGQQLLGWEFKLFRSAQEGKGSDGATYHELYQVTSAFYRGDNHTKFIFAEDPHDMDGLAQYFPIDNVLKVLPKLAE